MGWIITLWLCEGMPSVISVTTGDRNASKVHQRHHLLCCIYRCQVIYCQAQPKPQPANPQLGAEVALLSQLWGTTLRHTQPGIVVLPVSSLIITTVGNCSLQVKNLLVHYLFTTCSHFVCDLFMSCSWVVNDLFMTCLCLLHKLCMHNLFTLCLWLVHKLLMTCSRLVYA